MWSQSLLRWVSTDIIARKFPITEQPSLNPRACRVSTHTKSIFTLKGQYRLNQWNWYSNAYCDYFTILLYTQDGPPVPNIGLSLPHAGWRWPISTEASLHLHSKCSYGQHSGSCWCQHYRGQCWLLGPCFDRLLLLQGSNCVYSHLTVPMNI